MGTARDILQEIYLSDEVKTVVRSIKPRHLAEDILQHCFCELFAKPDEFILDLHSRGKLKWYIVRMMYKTSYFKDTPFTKQFGKETPTEDFADLKSEEPGEDMAAEVKNVVEKLYWYKKGILELYVEKGTYRGVSEATGIPLTSIGCTMKEIRKEVKKKLCQDK